MSFDDALRRVFDAAVQELTVLAAEERNRAREQGTDEGRAEGLKDGREQGRTEGHTEGRKEGHEAGRALGREEASQESLAALDAAVSAARAESAVSLAANTRLLDAIRALDTSQTLQEVLETLMTSAAAEGGRAGILLVRDGRLHGWKFHGFGSSLSDPSSLDLEPGNATSLAEGRDSVEIPLALFDETVAVLYADRDPALRPAAATPWRDTLEILARHAARALEALTAIKTARAIAGVQPGPRNHAASDEADDADSSARRYARLLVSEIKLYHEPAVVAGRRDRDLVSRLGGEISRARALYDQRVPASVRDRADYFRDELVRTLANGDATLLQLT
jgi:hypothetical protein